MSIFLSILLAVQMISGGRHDRVDSGATRQLSLIHI